MPCRLHNVATVSDIKLVSRQHYTEKNNFLCFELIWSDNSASKLPVVFISRRNESFRVSDQLVFRFLVSRRVFQNPFESKCSFSETLLAPFLFRRWRLKMLKHRTIASAAGLADPYPSQSSIPSSFVSQDSGNVSSDTARAFPRFPRHQRIRVSVNVCVVRVVLVPDGHKSRNIRALGI